jgi:sialate O-acetylesterase
MPLENPAMPRILRWSALLMAAALSRAASAAELRLPALISDHMVLQAGLPAPLWGQDKPGQLVKASLAGHQAEAKADAKGRWRLDLGPLPAGGPYALSISGSSALTVADVLVGEVWLASGQSNMEFQMAGTHDREKQLPAAKHPTLRLFYVERRAAAEPMDSMDLRGNWKTCTPETAREFSAVAYHFGRELKQALKTPVGLITASWGGTPAETWTPRPALDALPELAPLLKQWDGDREAIALWKDGAPFDVELKELRFVSRDPKGPALPVRLASADKNGLGGSWTHGEKPGSKGEFKDGRYFGLMQGGAWGGADSPLMPDGSPADLSGYEAVAFKARGKGQFALTFAQKNNTDPDHYGTQAMTLTKEWKAYSIPLSSLKQGDWGEPKPFTPDQFTGMGISVRVPYWPDQAALAYNGMIAPLGAYAFQGALWYQGESNAGRAGHYAALLRAMVKSWRAAAGRDFPFLVVQLPNYGAPCEGPCHSDWAELRAAQAQVLALPGTGVVTTIDLGEANNIHPRNKTEVGRRLALKALKLVYGKKLEDAGPAFTELKADGSSLVLGFDGKLKAAAVNSVEVAGKDGVFVRAQAELKKGVLKVWADKIKEPKAVRYAWTDNPPLSLVGVNGLPVMPFKAELK